MAVDFGAKDVRQRMPSDYHNRPASVASERAVSGELRTRFDRIYALRLVGDVGMRR